MKTTVDIFSGFLGAGKTMLIKKLLSEKVYGENTVIIENEFGEVGIDGDILKESNIEVKEINSGCICCQVTGGFSDAITQIIKQYNPENIIIEPSGVAKLTEILNILEGIKFQHKLEVRNIFTLVDVQNYDMYLKNFKEFYVNQIRKANKIVLSRTQFIKGENIKGILTSIEKINPKAEIIYKPWDSLNGKEIMRQHQLSNNEDIKEITKIKSRTVKTFRKEINHSASDVFESYPIKLLGNTSTEELEKKFEFIASNDRFGKVIRAKGIIESIDGGYYQFDYVPNEFKARKIKWSNKKVVSIIGSGLDKKGLAQLFK